LKEGFRYTPPKDQNSSIHILEGLTALYEVWPDEHLKSRIDEMLMLEASHALGRKNDTLTHMVSKRMCDHTIKNGWDPKSGATFESGYYFKDKDKISILESFTQWWAATESFHTMLIMSELYPDDPMDYYDKFTLSWDYCKNNLIDYEGGGWYRTGINENPREKEGDKGSIWKGNYHNARSLINCINILRKIETE
jgi:mannobiose 2-epimerase